jgi:hypothetical protein
LESVGGDRVAGAAETAKIDAPSDHDALRENSYALS